MVKYLVIFLLLSANVYALPYNQTAMTWEHGRFDYYLRGNSDTENIWNETSPYSDSYCDDNVWVSGIDPSPAPSLSERWLDSRSYDIEKAEWDLGNYTIASSPLIELSVDHDRPGTKKVFQSNRISCAGGYFLTNGYHYINSAVEFVYDHSEGSEYAETSSSWIPTVAYAFYRIADVKWGDGWTIFDVRAALRKSATNYPNFGYARSTYTGTKVDGYGMPSLSTALTYTLADLPVFSPFIQSVVYTDQGLRVRGVDWMSTLLENTTLVIFNSKPSESAAPSDGTIVFEGKFETTSGEIFIDLKEKYPNIELNTIYYLCAFSKHIDGSYTSMTIYEKEDGTIYNLDLYEFQITSFLEDVKGLKTTGGFLKSGTGKIINFN
jgi:hypothetical protein